MSARPADGPLLWNVAGLLADDVGADRHDAVRGVRIALPDDLELAHPIEGAVRLSRTNRGILADAELTTALAGACSRCLKAITIPIDVRIDEEYLPSIDFTTGQPVLDAVEPDVLRLTDHHGLDLEGPVRDAISLAEPIAPLCRIDCPGLCVVCGQPLETGLHDHPDEDIDPRFEALRGFRVDDR